MRKLLIGFALLGLVSLVPITSVTASSDDHGHKNQPCVDPSRSCVIATAFTYLNALVSHDAASVRFAPTAWRMNIGHVAAVGQAALRAAIVHEPVGAISNFRWTVDGDQAVAQYDLLVDLTRSSQSQTFAPLADDFPTEIIERFRVEHGLIYEIEVTYPNVLSTAPFPARPFRGKNVGRGPCPSDDRACIIATAGQYLSALITHNAAQVPLAADAWRVENGQNTGNSAAEVRASLESPAQNVNSAVSDVRWFIDDDQAVAYYVLYTNPNGTASGSQSPQYVGVRFRLQNGLIKEIESVSSPPDPPGTVPQPRPPWLSIS